jgi:hypothetical protein
MSAHTIDNVVLERLIPDLESQGYDNGELAIAISRPQVESFVKILSSLANNIGLSEAH